MIQDRDRRLLVFLMDKGVIRAWRDMWGAYHFKGPKAFEPVLDRMKKRQAPDHLHHAPKCPANRWSGAALVFHRCNCGAARYAAEAALTKSETASDV